MMNAQEFEKAVRELRQSQRRFFNCKKDDPDREKAKLLMREKEKEVLNVVETVMAIRPMGKRAESEREDFFLAVDEMMKKQKAWMKQGGGAWYMNPARDAEKRVDEFLASFDEQRRRQKVYEEQKRQMSLFG